MGNADKQFMIDYQHQGKSWVLDIYADDWADAERKLQSIAANGRVGGEIAMSFHVPTWSERFFRWFGFR